MSKKTTSVSSSFFQNKGMLLIVGLVVAAAVVFFVLTYVNEDFANNVFGSSNLKDLDVILFMDPSCPWCKKTLELLKKDNKLDDITIINVRTDDGRKEAVKYGVNKGLPAFVSKKTNLGTVGHPESVKMLVKDLTDKSKINDNNDGMPIEDLKIVLFYKDNCKWCNKSKDDLSNMGIMNIIEMKDVNSEEGREALKQFNLNTNTSVPVYASRATNKTTVGYKPFNEILDQLK